MTNTGSKSVSFFGWIAHSRSSSERLYKIRRLSILIALTAVSLLPARIDAQEDANEYEVKAAFLCTFASFVEWPIDAGSGPATPIVIGIIGKDPFGSEIDRAIEGKSANGRPLIVRRISTLDAYSYCHIVFVSLSERENLPKIFAAIGNRSVLTVSETDKFARIGGVINFITVENRVRFEINQAAAERAGLKISSKLLRLGRVIRT